MWLVRIVALRTAALATGVFTIAVIAVSLAAPALPWDSSFEQGQQAAFSASLVICVALAIGAAQAAATLSRSAGRGEILTAVRPARARFLTGAPLLAIAALSVLAVVAVVAVRVVDLGGSIDVPWTALRALSTFALSVVSGAALGTLLSPLYAIPLAAAAGALPAMVSIFGGSGVFALNGPHFPLAGFVANGWYAIVGVSAACTATAALWVLLIPRSSLSWPRILSSVTAATIAVASASFIPEQIPYSRLEAPLTCTEDSPSVCFYPGYGTLAALAADDAKSITALAARAGLDTSQLPQKLILGGDPPSLPPRGTGRIILGSVDVMSGRISTPVLVAALTTPAWCPQLRAQDAPVGLLTQVGLTSNWLLHVVGVMDDQAFAVDAKEIAELPPPRQAEFANRMMAAGNECEVAAGVPGP